MNISSEKNARIKNLLKMQKKSSLCIKQNLIVVEGVREIQKALQGGYLPKELFLCKTICKEKVISKNFPKVTDISVSAFKRAVYRGGSQGAIGVFHRSYLKLRDLNISNNPLLLVLENIEKPGNLGAILRSAQATAVEGVILCNFENDIFHPNVIRSSLGTVFTQKIVNADFKEFIPWLRNRKITLIASVLEKNALSLYNSDLCLGIALIIGAESQGISKKMRQVTDIFLRIPMHDTIDSLNVSNATAVILFETVRQRLLKFNKKS